MSTTEVIARDLENLNHAVFGNGQPGLKTRVERIEVRIETGVKILWSLLVLAVPSALSLIAIAVTYLQP